MTAQQAREILLRYRPGTRDGEDSEMAEALALAKADAELGRWFDQHCEFQIAVRERLRAVTVPASLKQAILAREKILPLPQRPQRSPGHAGGGAAGARAAWWQSVPALAAAAAVLVMVGIWALGGLSQGGGGGQPDYTEYQARMVATVLREYRMDVESHDLKEVRDYMESKGSPDDFELTPGLQQLELAGGGFLRWRNNPISMVCFRRQDKEMVYLFVINKDRVKNPPPSEPAVRQVYDLETATWTTGDKTYLLAAPPEKDFKKKYL